MEMFYFVVHSLYHSASSPSCPPIIIAMFILGILLHTTFLGEAIYAFAYLLTQDL